MAIWIRQNGGNWNKSGTANPATNTGGASLAAFATSTMYPLAAIDNATLTFNFGQSAFAHTVPSGFTAGWPAHAGGFTTLNPASVTGDGSVGGGGLTLGGGASQTTAIGYDGYESGKFYYEFTVDSFDFFTSQLNGGGISKSTYSGSGSALGTVGTFLNSHNDCDLYVGGAAVITNMFTASPGDVIGVAVILEGTTPTPTANDDSASTPENTAVAINVLANDNANGGVLDQTSVVISSAASHGGTSVNATTGVVTYTPNTSYTGTDTFQYTVANTNGNRSTAATVTVTISGAGTPTARPDSATTPENVAIAISVLANDSPGTGSTLDYTSVVITTAAVNGTAVANGTTGIVTYTPNSNFVGSDTFYYKVSNLAGNQSGAAAVIVTVTAVTIAPPTARPDSASTPENTAVTIPVLANDSAGGGTLDPTSVVISTTPVNGTASANSAGVVTYTPNSSFVGTDVFQYTVADTNGQRSNAASVTITVVPPVPPTANPDSATTKENSAVAIAVLANDIGGGGTLDATSVVISTTAVFGGTAVNGVTGVVTYTPHSGFSGADAFSYTVADTNGVRSAPGLVSVTVTPLAPPTAVLDAATTPQNVAVIIPVLANDTGGDGAIDPTTVVLAAAPSYGAASVDATNGDVTYTPHLNFFGVDIFPYTVADTNGIRSSPGSIIVTVTTSVPSGDNNYPLQVEPGGRGMIYNWRLAKPGTPASDVVYTITVPPTAGEVLINDPEPSADWVSTSSFTQADINDGYVAYQNTGDIDGADTFTLSIVSGTLAPVVETFAIRVLGENLPARVQFSGDADIFYVPPDGGSDFLDAEVNLFPVPPGVLPEGT